MLRLIKKSSYSEEFKSYYEAFSRTRKHANDSNDTPHIGGVIRDCDIVFADGRSLLTTRNTNLTPFSKENIVIYDALEFDWHNESKVKLDQLANNFYEWILSCLKHTLARWFIVDFSSKKEQIEQTFVNYERSYNRSEIYYASAELFVEISKIVWQKLKSFVSEQPIKFIFHFDNYSPLIANIAKGVEPLVFMPEFRLKNGWTERYQNTRDSTGLFVDVLAQIGPGHSALLFTFDDTCLPLLVRSVLVQSPKKLIVCAIYEDGDVIVSNVGVVKDLVFQIMAEIKLSGTLSDYLADLHVMDMISDLYDDLETLVEDYKKARGSGLFKVDWRNSLTIEQTGSVDNIIAVINDRVSESTVKNKLSLIAFMADYSVIADTPSSMQINFITVEDVSKYISPSMKVWVLYQLILFDLSEKVVNISVLKDKRILYISYALMYLMPHVVDMWGNEITTMKDLIEFCTIEGSVVRTLKSMLSDDGYKRMLDEERLVSQEDDGSLGPADLTTVDYYKSFIDFLSSFDKYWTNTLWRDSNASLTNFVLYDSIIPDSLRPMFYIMGKRRVEYMERESLIVFKPLPVFNIDRDWFDDNASTVVRSKFLYQVVRILPSAWRWSNQLTEDKYTSLLANRIPVAVYTQPALPKSIERLSSTLSHFLTTVPQVNGGAYNLVRSKIVQMGLTRDWTYNESVVTADSKAFPSVQHLYVRLLCNIYSLDLPTEYIPGAANTLLPEVEKLIRPDTTVQDLSELATLLQLCSVTLGESRLLSVIALCTKVGDVVEEVIEEWYRDYLATSIEEQEIFDQINYDPAPLGSLDVAKVFGFVLTGAHACRIGKSDSRMYLKYITRVCESVCDLLVANGPSTVATEFSFDLIQPLFQPLKDEDSYLLLRLYPIHDVTELKVKDSTVKYMDVDTYYIDIKSYVGLGEPPSTMKAVYDPVESVYYLCLAWDYREFVRSKVMHVQKDMESLNAGHKMISDIYVSLLEYNAAAWWLSVPELRAKIHARGGPWNSMKWSLWLMKACELGLLKEVTLDPLLQYANRIKVFSGTRMAPCKMVSEELGLDVQKYLHAIPFNNLKFTEQFSATKEKNSEIEPASARKSVDWNQRKKYDSDRITPYMKDMCAIVDGYEDPSADDIGLYRSAQTTLVYLPVYPEEDLPLNDPNWISDHSFMYGMKAANYPASVVEVKNVSQKRNASRYLKLVEDCTISLKTLDNILNTFFPYAILADLVFLNLPLFFGISYKFHIYYEVENTVVLVQGGKETRVTYEQFLADDMKDKTRSYKVISKFMPDRSSLHFVFQGVYGNKINMQRLYQLFFNAYEITMSDLFLKGMKVKVSSLADIKTMTTYRSYTALKRAQKYGDLLYKSNIDSVAFLFGEQSDLSKAAMEDFGGAKDLILGYAKHITMNNNITVFMSHWNSTLLSSDVAFIASSSDLFTTKRLLDEFALLIPIIVIGSMGANQFNRAIVPYNVILTYEDRANDYIIDIIRFFENVATAANNYKKSSKKRMSDLKLILDAYSLYPLLSTICDYSNVPMFVPKSMSTMDNILHKMTTGDTQNVLESEYETIVDKLAELSRNKELLFIQNEETIEELREYKGNGGPAFSGIEYTEFIYSVKSMLDRDITYTTSDLTKINDTLKGMIQSAQRPALMRSIINGLATGSIRFLTTNKEYDSIGLSLDSGTGDSARLWEQIEEGLSAQQRSLFEEPTQTDKAIDELNNEIVSGRFTGVALEAKKKSLDKIKESLKEGREVMMYLAMSNVPNIMDDTDLILLIYRIKDEKSPLDKGDDKPSGNKLDDERRMRNKCNAFLSRNKLSLVFSGQYLNQHNITEQRKRFASGLTFIMANEKRAKLKIKSGPTFIESLFICMYYKNMSPEQRSQKPYYMKYNDSYQAIFDIYSSTPTIKMDGLELPLSQILDMDVIKKEFDNRFVPSAVKAENLFENYLSKVLDINLRIIHFQPMNDSTLQRSGTIELINKYHKTDNYVSMINVGYSNKYKIPVQFFEPLFDV